MQHKYSDCLADKNLSGWCISFSCQNRFSSAKWIVLTSCSPWPLQNFSCTWTEVQIDVQEFCGSENILYLNEYMTNQEIYLYILLTEMFICDAHART